MAGLAACTRKGSSARRPLLIGVANYSGMSPFYVALERGYFRAAGLQVQPQLSNRPTELMPLLTSGRLDATLAIVQPSVINAIARGSEVRIVFGRDVVAPSCGDAGVVHARKAAFPHGTSDLREWGGKKFYNGGLAGVGEFLLDTALKSAGLDPKLTPRVPLGVPEAVAALKSGAIDAIFNGNNLAMNFPFGPGVVREDAGAKALAGLQISHILFGAGFLRADPAIGGAFLACCLRGLREFQAGATPQFLRDLVASQGRDPSVLTACRDYDTPDGSIDMKSIQAYLDWAVFRGYTPVAPPLEKCVDTRFWEIAHKQAAS
jgi:ABC-type nitrate/sulfonate/bicarbonate transport system substrate-binding protein